MPKRVYNKAVSGVARAMSKPARIRSNYITKRSEIDYNILKSASSAKKEPQFDSSGKPTEGFKARTMAPRVRKRVAKNTQKLTNPGRVRKVAQNIITLGTKWPRKK